VWDIVVKKFTFAISSPDEFLLIIIIIIIIIRYVQAAQKYTNDNIYGLRNLNKNSSGDEIANVNFYDDIARTSKY